MDLFDRDELHISLSRSFFLRLHQIHAFVNKFHSELSPMKPIDITFGSFVVLENDEKTRGFIAAVLEEGSTNVTNAISMVDSACESFQLSSYYDNPLPHCSFASFSKCPKTPLPMFPPSTPLDIDIRISQALVKIGNKNYSYEFK